VTHSLSTMLLVALIAVLAPPLADAVGRRAPVPMVVFEIVLGILVGPDVLGWAHQDDFIHALSQFGLATRSTSPGCAAARWPGPCRAGPCRW
jgi:Kef-type K+ transport system membrane component KefB